LLTFKQIVTRLIEKDDAMSYEWARKWILSRALEWFAPALDLRVFEACE